MIAELRRIIILFHPGTEGCNHQAYFLRREHLVKTRLFNVEDLSFKRKNRLITAIAPLFGRPASRIAFDKVKLAQCWVAFLTVGELAGQRTRIQSALSSRQL